MRFLPVPVPGWRLCSFAAVSLTLMLGCEIAAAAVGPVVSVTGGRVQGRLLPAPGGAVFQGIPFAAAPVGDLRWREPAPVKAWKGIRDASTYGAPCAQVTAEWNAKAAALGSEDCLFLNVWNSEWPARTRKPVMVWIHGGANMGGSALGAGGIEPPFDGESLARHGVVMVTLQYRLGVFGFIAHPELTAESSHHASGNYGLMDQIAALRWVRDNIAKFGGDPSNVTIFGQSAGALDVGLLMTSPLAKGLFHRVIEQSGTVTIGGGPTATLAEVEQAGVQLAAKLNAPATGAIHFLRTLTTAEVLKASPPYGGGGPMRAEPDIDGYVLPQSPAEVFRTGQEAPVPLITGNTGRELGFSGDAAALKKAIEEFYGLLAPRAFELYGLAGTPQTGVYPPHGPAKDQYRTDTFFRCGAVLTAIEHSSKYPTFEYEFTIGNVATGTPHSGDLQYVFGVRGVKETTDPDPTLSGQVQTYWTNFAKTGDPNGGGVPAWPKYDFAKRGYLELTNAGPLVKSDLRGPFCELFSEKFGLKGSGASPASPPLEE
jgi:para-nitrobenzyl esterase